MSELTDADVPVSSEGGCVKFQFGFNAPERAEKGRMGYAIGAGRGVTGSVKCRLG